MPGEAGLHLHGDWVELSPLRDDLALDVDPHAGAHADCRAGQNAKFIAGGDGVVAIHIDGCGPDCQRPRAGISRIRTGRKGVWLRNLRRRYEPEDRAEKHQQDKAVCTASACSHGRATLAHPCLMIPQHASRVIRQVSAVTPLR